MGITGREGKAEPKSAKVLDISNDGIYISILHIYKYLVTNQIQPILLPK
jgi:hypothetical protein